MTVYTINATRTQDYQFDIEADSETDAMDQIKDWIADDFESYEKTSKWDFEINS